MAGTGALVRGGVGSEIKLHDILPPHLQNVSKRAQTEPVAREYEKNNPGSVVVCDWETISDLDIEGDPAQGIPPMPQHERQRALADREHLAHRRAAAKEVRATPPPLRGGDPDRMRTQLDRLRNDLAHLETTHPQYERVFFDWTQQINLIEKDLGLPITEYKIGFKAPLEALTKEQRDRLKADVTKYTAANPKAREKAIATVSDPLLLQFMLDAETDPTLREQIVGRMAQAAVAK